MNTHFVTESINRNFSMPGVRVDEDAALTLDERGMIRESNRAAESLFGYRRGELIWQHVSLLLPRFSGVALVQNGILDPRIGFLCRCGHLFESRLQEGGSFYSEVHLVQLQNGGRPSLRLIVRPVDCLND